MSCKTVSRSVATIFFAASALAAAALPFSSGAAGASGSASRQAGDLRSMDARREAAKVQELERAADDDPTNPARHHLVGTFYFEMARQPDLAASDRREYLQRALAAETRALDADPGHFGALVYKNLVLREQAASEQDPAKQRALISEADELRARAAATRGSATDSGVVTFGNYPPPPPPPAVPGAGPIKWVYGDASFTSTGAAQALRKIKDVQPVYPPMAITLGVQGTVLLEATVDNAGTVTSARIVESIPMLNQSVIDAVRQWRFDPSTVGAGSGPVVITVMASFRPPR